MTTAYIILGCFGLYVLAGVVYCVVAGLRAIRRLDPKARGAHRVFWVLITPGVVALWPLVWKRSQVMTAELQSQGTGL